MRTRSAALSTWQPLSATRYRPLDVDEISQKGPQHIKGLIEQADITLGISKLSSKSHQSILFSTCFSISYACSSSKAFSATFPLNVSSSARWMSFVVLTHRQLFE